MFVNEFIHKFRVLYYLRLSVVIIMVITVFFKKKSYISTYLIFFFRNDSCYKDLPSPFEVYKLFLAIANLACKSQMLRLVTI